MAMFCTYGLCEQKIVPTSMWDAGCRSIYYGIETGSPRIQQISRKKLDLNIFNNILNTTLELNIVLSTLSFIVGYPRKRIGRCVYLFLDLLSSCIFNSKFESITSSSPNTRTEEPHYNFEYKGDLGFDDYILKILIFLHLNKDDAEIMQKNPEIFMNHHYYKSILPASFLC